MPNELAPRVPPPATTTLHSRNEMKRFREPAILLLCCIGLLVLSTTGSAPQNTTDDGNSLAWHQLAFVYGIGLLLLSILSYMLGHINQTLVGCVRDSFICRETAYERHSKPGSHAVGWAALGFALLLGGWLRWKFLDQQMRLDEGYSFIFFVSTELSNVFLYPFPNNHVLNTILERLSCALFGTSPQAIRLPAFISGLGIVVLSYQLGRRLGGECGGVLAAIGAAVWPYLVLFSTNGRGYTLMTLLALLIAYLSIDDEGHLRIGRVPLTASLAALGMLTMPSMLFALAGLMLWWVALMRLDDRTWREVMIEMAAPFSTLFLILTLLFYTPVALVSGGLQGVMANKEARPLSIGHFIHQAGPHIEHTATALSVDVPQAALIALSVLATANLLIAFRQRRHAAAFLLPCIVLGSVLVFVAKRSIPFPRTWIFLIPFFLICADRLLALLLDRWRMPLRCATVALFAIAAALFARQLVVRDAIAGYAETGVAPGARELAQKLSGELAVHDWVCALVPENVILFYYFRRLHEQNPISRVAGAPRFHWLHTKPARPTRGFQSGWETVMESDQMYADRWMLDGIPNFVRIPEMNCWQPAILDRGTK
jgi:hypothetical protein